MALNNPDILFPLLEDLAQKIRNLNHRISYSMDDAEQLLNISSDQVDQANFDTNHTAYLKTADETQASYWEEEVCQMLARISNLSGGISNTEAKLKNLNHACRQSVLYWNDQHSMATYELRQAEERYNLAVNNMKIAQVQYNNAQASYNSAQNDYYNCRNAKDSQGRPLNNNCSGYSAAMDRARREVDEAMRQYNYWEGKKSEAKRDIYKWEARIADCEDSLKILKSTIQETDRATIIVQEAANFAQRSLEEITSAKNILIIARELNCKQDELVTQNLIRIKNYGNLLDAAKNAFINANKLAQQAQLYGSIGCEQIDRKIDTLKDFSYVPNTLI